ncbi:hypothetical protein AAHC03_024383 [Spirometra sp. Aus1]
MDFLLSVYPNADAESKQSRLIPPPSPSSGVSPRSVGNNSLGDDDTKSEKVSSPHVTGCTDNETDLSQSGASDDDDSYVPKAKSQKKRTDASSRPSVKRSAPRRKPAKEVSSARSVQKAGAKRPAHQASHSSVSSGTKKRRQASSSTVDDTNERASLSSISSISDDEEDPLASWQKADAARKSEIEVKLQELEKRRQQEEEKAIRQAKKHISKSKQRNLHKHSDGQSTSPRPTSSLSTDLVKSEPETEGISVPTVASPHASSVTSDSESAVQRSRESKEARRMAKRLMKKEAKREAKKADKRNAKRLEKALRKQQQIQQLAQLEEQEGIVKDEDAGVGTFLEDAATAADDNASEVSGDDTAAFAPVVKNGEGTSTVEDAMTTKDFVGSPTEGSPDLSAPIEHSPLSATSVSSSKHQLSSNSRSPELTPSHPVPTEEAARVHASPTSLPDEPVDGRLHRHHQSPTSPSTPPESDNQMSPTTITPSQQSQKQQSPSSDQNLPSVTSPVIETPPPVADVHSPNLSTSPHESDEDVSSGHRRRRDRPSSHRKRRLARVSSASSQSEEEENRVPDKEIEKHTSHHRHHGKLAKTDGHVANGGSKGTVEARDHSQKTANGGLERKRAATPDCLQQLRNLNRQLKASLLRGRDDHANALAIFDQICAVPATLVQLTQASDLTDCVKKCRRYKLSAEVRDKAQQVLAHFHSIQAAASPEEVQQAMAIVAERVKQAKMSQTASGPINQDENSQGSPAVPTSVVSQAHVGADTPSATATAPRAISPTRYWEEKRASIKAELDERANSVLSMIRATEERVAAASAASATSPTGFKRPSYSYDPPANTATVDAGMEDDATVISRVDEIASYFEANAWLSKHTLNSSKASRGRHSRPQSRTSALPADLLAKRELIASKVAAKRAADRIAAAAAGAVGGVLSSKQALSAPTGVKIDSLSKIPLPPSPPVTGKTAAGTENMALANGDDDDSDIYDLLGV